MEVISLINMKGGVGKTTVAINIAHYIAEKLNKRVLIIDVDPQFNATQCLMNDDDYIEHLQKGQDTILSVFQNDITTEISTVTGAAKRKSKELSDIHTVNISKNLFLLPGNLNLYQLEMAAGAGRENRLRNFLASKSEEFDFVIIDTPPTPSVWMTSALIASNYYLIAVKPDPLSMTGIDLLKAIVSQRTDNYALTIKCIGIILNMVEDHTIVYKDACSFLTKEKWRKDLVFEKHIPKRTKIAREQTSNRFILDLDDNDAKRALSSIVNELMDRINGKKTK
nr:AAA family ATPase [Bacteroides intestinalis]